jgi:hypothetical protein
MKFNYFDYDESGEMIQAGYCRDPLPQRSSCTIGTLYVCPEVIFDEPQKYRFDSATMSLVLKDSGD